MQARLRTTNLTQVKYAKIYSDKEGEWRKIIHLGGSSMCKYPEAKQA